ncbi:hypothetical protein Mal4_26720 [Maioricimonas rarisocia]|uniref:Uncharacterized protein n=1 Tax=Maioricimonas rarisocia TaxID=2528026 RepID=A0A517Z782_9PLAN|nr:hypothetical protein [Maioricimonas rarisocia]QDU38345.1 hypothetical protein Mal4_26720 [Maioricimonas rarisocia]
MKQFTRSWMVTYGLMCAGLLLGSHVFGHVSDWSAQVIGGADCNSQEELTDADCEARDGQVCTAQYQKCNQSTGNATKICQADAGDESCAVGRNSTKCKGQSDDELSSNGADGNPCTPTQI